MRCSLIWRLQQHQKNKFGKVFPWMSFCNRLKIRLGFGRGGDYTHLVNKSNFFLAEDNL